MKLYLKEPPMLDYYSTTVQTPMKNWYWDDLPPFERILQIYNFG